MALASDALKSASLPGRDAYPFSPRDTPTTKAAKNDEKELTTQQDHYWVITL